MFKNFIDSRLYKALSLLISINGCRFLLATVVICSLSCQQSHSYCYTMYSNVKLLGNSMWINYESDIGALCAMKWTGDNLFHCFKQRSGYTHQAIHRRKCRKKFSSVPEQIEMHDRFTNLYKSLFPKFVPMRKKK